MSSQDQCESLWIIPSLSITHMTDGIREGFDHPWL